MDLNVSMYTVVCLPLVVLLVLIQSVWNHFSKTPMTSVIVSKKEIRCAALATSCLNWMLKSDVCILCSAVILSGLRYTYKQVHLRGKVNQTSVEDSYVQLGLYKTALHVCELAASDQAFLFSSVYHYTNLTVVCPSVCLSVT